MSITPNTRRKGVQTLHSQYVNQKRNVGVGTIRNAIGWGKNNWGDLGLNDIIHRSSPVFFNGGNWQSIVCINDSTVGVKYDGTLWAWGNNGSGQLGQNDLQSYSSPVQIPGAGWGDLSSAEMRGLQGSSWFLLKKVDGTLWGMGNNGNGQLGQNDTVPRSSPVQIGINTTGPGNIEDKAWYKLVWSGTGVVGIAETDRTLWAWGSSSYGIYNFGGLGQHSRSNPEQISTEEWIDIARSDQCILGIKTDNTLWGIGRNNIGQLGQNELATRSSPIQITNFTDWQKIDVSNDHAVGTRTGTVYTWGSNGSGRLGLSDATPRSSPHHVNNTYTNGQTLEVYAVNNGRTFFQVGVSTITGLNAYMGCGNDEYSSLIPDNWREAYNSVPRSSPIIVGPYWEFWTQDPNYGYLEYPDATMYFYDTNNVAIVKDFPR